MKDIRNRTITCSLSQEIFILKKWYTVKGLFRWYFKDNGETSQFEERIIIVKATSFDDALDKAEVEAVEYCEDDPKANFRIESLNKFSAYELMDKIESGIEIFSKRITSSLDSITYLKQFHLEKLIQKR